MKIPTQVVGARVLTVHVVRTQFHQFLIRWFFGPCMAAQNYIAHACPTDAHKLYSLRACLRWWHKGGDARVARQRCNYQYVDANDTGDAQRYRHLGAKKRTFVNMFWRSPNSATPGRGYTKVLSREYSAYVTNITAWRFQSSVGGLCLDTDTDTQYTCCKEVATT